MNRLKTMKYILWLPVLFGFGTVLASPAGAGPFNGGQSHRAEVRRDIVLVDNRSYRRHRSRGYRGGQRGRYRGGYRHRIITTPSHRRYRDVYPVRRYGRHYRGYGHHYRDADAYHWLAFTAITVKMLDLITVSQQRAHESAQIRATTAPVGETIYWDQGSAQGTVTAVRDGRSSTGRYCREFQQTLIVGGKTESAYGTACRQPDGSWQLISQQGSVPLR